MLKYWSAYLVPFAAALGLAWGGPWAWLAVGVIYVAIPFADQLRGIDTRNLEGADLQRAQQSRWAEAPLWLALPVQWGLIVAFLVTWQTEATVWERIGWIASVGLSSGALGITIAHEWVHRRDRVEYASGHALLLSVLYMHFAIEHVRGHHQQVGTDRDPASASFGQSVYAFVPRSIWRQLGSTWRLEAERLAKRGLGPWTLRNEVLWIVLIEGAWLAVVGGVFGVATLLAYLAVAAVAVTLLEVVNYVEHYGLRRKIDEKGRLEPVRSYHSWNSDHVFSRTLLFELPRHTDHHMNGSRTYPSLQSVSGAPQLPAGYPTMVLMALVPPLWFRVMNPRVAAVSAAR